MNLQLIVVGLKKERDRIEGAIAAQRQVTTSNGTRTMKGRAAATGPFAHELVIRLGLTTAVDLENQRGLEVNPA
jgi:hypothetical protein